MENGRELRVADFSGSFRQGNTSKKPPLFPLKTHAVAARWSLQKASSEPGE